MFGVHRLKRLPARALVLLACLGLSSALLAMGTDSSQAWGALGDGPTPADFDGDRKADLTVYRP